mmetsp:Transcript_5507/g.13209  ORF Transcript_5507/g.13209 Transcript_5507/m.13209 type:complete len:318 (+) Transcript_5507:308-1261(+)
MVQAVKVGKQSISSLQCLTKLVDLLLVGFVQRVVTLPMRRGIGIEHASLEPTQEQRRRRHSRPAADVVADIGKSGVAQIQHGLDVLAQSTDSVFTPFRSRISRPCPAETLAARCTGPTHADLAQARQFGRPCDQAFRIGQSEQIVQFRDRATGGAEGREEGAVRVRHEVQFSEIQHAGEYAAFNRLLPGFIEYQVSHRWAEIVNLSHAGSHTVAGVAQGLVIAIYHMPLGTHRIQFAPERIVRGAEWQTQACTDAQPLYIPDGADKTLGERGVVPAVVIHHVDRQAQGAHGVSNACGITSLRRISSATLVVAEEPLG